MIRAVRHVDENLKMPEKGKLSASQIEMLVHWVERGAVYPTGSIAANSRREADHWAFQPPTEQSLPVVIDTTWPRSPIDHFILARLESAQRVPAAAADKRTLIRRVTFDLTGLPPTSQEIADFVGDECSNSFAKAVERLLDSPAYGEHWGQEGLAADAAVPEKLESLYPEATKADLAKLREQLAALEQAGPDLPATMRVTEDEVADVNIHFRGDTQKLGDIVSRHVPAAIKGATVPEFSSKMSGRLQLAQWLADREHPLTARVFVNRVWR